MIAAEFNARSAFSFLRGASLPAKLVERAALLGYRAIALTDHDGFYGSARAHEAARRAGIQAVVACSLPWGETHLPVIAATHQAYSALCQSLSDYHLQAKPPQENPRNLPDCLVLTGDRDGPLCRHLLRHDSARARQVLKDLLDRFGRHSVYLQLTRHLRADEPRLLRDLIELAREFQLPLLASNAPLMADRGDRFVADAFTCLRHHCTLDDAGDRLTPNSERHLKSPEEMQHLFKEIPEALSHTHTLLERCVFGLEKLNYRFPDFTDSLGQPLSQSEQSTLLRRLTYAGACRVYPDLNTEVKAQLEHELALIHKLSFSGYFLIVHEIMEFARGRGILCQGRGSAANSAVCYCLGITKVDPISQGLLFERFLSENRRSWPDIDIDFPSGDRREEVIQYVFRRYGTRGAALTANVITYRPRSAFREMSKVLGFPESIANRFSEICRTPKVTDHEPHRPENSAPTMSDLYPRTQIEELEETISRAGIPQEHPRRKALLQLYQAVLGLPRHLGQHSGGMIICDRGLDPLVPLQAARMPGRTIIQWDKDDCEDLGFVKVDLLGLGMLAAMQDALQFCAEQGHPVDLAKLPKNDPATFDLMCRADTIGTFQVESRAQMATLPIMRPRHFYDVAVEVAIIRPGPIVGDLVHPYLNRRTGREPIDYIHPDFEPVLKRTLGVPLFQEQVLRMAMIIAGFNGAEADELRRALGFKRDDTRMHAVVEKLTQRMNARGVTPTVQEKVIQSIGSFALYGFPESHAISFALIAYASCWLKVHRPAEFYCGLINNQPMGFYNVNTLIQDARRHGIRILPVDLTKSKELTAIEAPMTLRLGWHRIKGLSKACINRLLQERTHSEFKDLEDFLRRVRPTKKERRLLAEAGALNKLPNTLHRRQALWQAELPLLQDDMLPTKQSSPLPRMTLAERVAADYRTQSHSTGPHPIAIWRRQNPEFSTDLANSQSLSQRPHGSPTSIAGLVVCRQRPGTAKGHCFISLEDEFGIANLFVPRDTFQQLRLLISTEAFLLAHGHKQSGEGGTHTLFVNSIEALSHANKLPSSESHDFH